MSGRKVAPPDEVIAAKKQQLETLLGQCAQVERMLAICTDQCNRLGAEALDLQRGTARKEQEAEDTERSLDDQVAFMRSFTKQSEEQLSGRQERLSKSVAEAEVEAAALRQKLLETQERKQLELIKWEDEADAMQHQMDEKALLFGMHLRESLERLRA